MAKKLRVFLIDEKSGKPRANVVLEVKAEWSQPENTMITLGMRQWDRVGYLSITIPDVKPLHLWITPLGELGHRVDAAETVFGPYGETGLVMSVPNDRIR